jgi:hypothetical protein
MRLLLGVGLLVLANCPAFACGISWLLPKSHFEGVDAQGYLMHSEKIGEIKLDDGLVLPVITLFETDFKSSSQYLGMNWMLPILESKVVQTDENTFQMWQPDGLYRKFKRDKKNPNILNNGSGWRGQIDGDKITLWAECGTRIEFVKGKITALQIKNHKLSYSYLGNLVSEIKEGRNVLLKVNTDDNDEHVTGLTLANGKKISWELGQKPRIQVIKEQKLIGGIDKALVKLRTEDGLERQYGYGTDDKLNPTFTRNQITATWNPVSGFIVKDADWKYDITANTKSGANAAIGRVNEKGQREYWFYDKSRGSETIVETDGTKSVSTWFPSGKLFGKIRSVKKEKAGKIIYEKTVSYNENGNLIRKLDQGVLWEYQYRNLELIAYRKNTEEWRYVKKIMENIQ